MLQRDLPAGSHREQALRSRIDQAQIVVLLLSVSLLRQHAALIDHVLDLQERKRLQVVPVLSRSVTLPPRLAALQRLPRHGKPLAVLGPEIDDAWVEIQSEIQRLLDQGSRTQHAVYRGNQGAAVHLDRTKQWQALVRICQGPQDALFLVHGPRRQNVSLFRQRIWYYLSEPHNQTHQVVGVPFRLQGRQALSAEDWEINLRGSLCGQLRLAPGPTEVLLRQAAAHLPLFLFIGDNPIDHLPAAQEAALGEFLGQRLPALIRAAGAENPVRVLFSVDYRADAPSLVPRVHECGAAAVSVGVPYHPLDPIAPPPWSEVETYLREHDPRPLEDDIATMRVRYAELTAPGREASFLELAEELDRILLHA